MSFDTEAKRRTDFSQRRCSRERCLFTRIFRRMTRCVISRSFDRLHVESAEKKWEIGKSRIAFTILELLIVLVIMVVILAIAWPQINRRIRRSDLKQVAITLKELIADARLSAMQSGECWELRFSDLSGSYQIGPASSFGARELNETKPTSFQSAENGYPIHSELDTSLLITTQPRNKFSFADNDQNDVEFETIRIGKSNSDQLDGDHEKSIWLDPQGRALETEIIVLDYKSSVGISIKIRGLTGQVEIEETFKVHAKFEFPEDSSAANQEADLENPDLELGV